MDGYDGYVVGVPGAKFEGVTDPLAESNIIESTVSMSLYDGPIYPYSLATHQTSRITTYTMRATDDNSPTLTYRVWKSIGSPDFNCDKYGGEYDGGTKNFSNVIVVQAITNF